MFAVWKCNSAHETDILLLFYYYYLFYISRNFLKITELINGWDNSENLLFVFSKFDEKIKQDFLEPFLFSHFSF